MTWSSDIMSLLEARQLNYPTPKLSLCNPGQTTRNLLQVFVIQYFTYGAQIISYTVDSESTVGWKACTALNLDSMVNISVLFLVQVTLSPCSQSLNLLCRGSSWSIPDTSHRLSCTSFWGGGVNWLRLTDPQPLTLTYMWCSMLSHNWWKQGSNLAVLP